MFTCGLLRSKVAKDRRPARLASKTGGYQHARITQPVEITSAAEADVKSTTRHSGPSSPAGSRSAVRKPTGASRAGQTTEAAVGRRGGGVVSPQQAATLSLSVSLCLSLSLSMPRLYSRRRRVWEARGERRAARRALPASAPTATAALLLNYIHLLGLARGPSYMTSTCTYHY